MTNKNTLFVNLNAATMGESDAPYGLIKDAAIAVMDGVIEWVGPAASLPDMYISLDRTSLGGRLVTPGLIDCHTHIVHGGDRAVEFEMRLNGASYEEVARAGGGIVSTVTTTRNAAEDQLLQDALRRVDVLIAEGVTTIEIKSGYGLDTETELRMLRVARAVVANRPIRVKTTFLGAHATPTEYEGRDDVYIDEVCIPALRAAHAEGLVDVPQDLIPNALKDAFSRANKEHQTAMLVNADFPSGRMRIAIDQHLRGNLDSAAEAYLAVLKIDSGFNAARMNLAQLYYSQGKTEATEELYRTVIEREPQASEAHYSLGLLMAEQARYEQAALSLESAATTGNNPRAWYNLAVLNQQSGKSLEAEKAYLAALQLMPGNAEFINGLVSLYGQ